MISKKIYLSQLDYDVVISQLLQNQSHDRFEKRANSSCLYFPNGVSIRIFALQKCTKITIARRPDRNNIQHFLDAIDLVEKRIKYDAVPLKSYGEIQ